MYNNKHFSITHFFIIVCRSLFNSNLVARIIYIGSTTMMMISYLYKKNEKNLQQTMNKEKKT